MARRDEIDTLLAEKKRRLHQQILKEARFGYSTPPEVSMEIEDLEKAIVKLEQERASLPDESEFAPVTSVVDPAPTGASFNATKRKALEAQIKALQEEYEAASGQWSRALSEVDRVRLKRTMDNLDAKIVELDTELARIKSAGPSPAVAQLNNPAAPIRSLRVFLSHASEDKPQVREVYQKLVDQGIDAWLDEEKLLPGQNWKLEISRAVRLSDVILVFLSKKAVTKAGYVQKEIKQALDVADEQPEGVIFLIPAKLEPCDLPDRLSHVQWVNLYEEQGWDRLLRALSQKARAQSHI